jgi:biopolymer transport protein ExbD
MGASIGTEGSGRPQNVELNIIPFIDLMSCLTAFLLVTAVWVNISQLDVTVAGKSRDQIKEPAEDPELSVLVEADEIWIGVSRVEEYQRIPRSAAGYDWSKLEELLRVHKASSFFTEKSNIQIAAESTRSEPVPYQAMILAMDVAVKAGFTDVAMSDPDGLYARPHM